MLRSTLMTHEVVHHRGHVYQDRGPERTDLFEQGGSGAALRKQGHGGADGEGKEQVAPGRISEIELRDRKGHVFGRHAQHSLPV